MDRKERIFAYICDDLYIPLRTDELSVVLDVPKADYDDFINILNELTTEGRIYKTKKGKYVACGKNTDIVSGVLSCNANKGFGFVKCEGTNNDIFIDNSNMSEAYHNDSVLVKIIKDSNHHNHREGQIIRVLKRGNDKIIGVIRGIKGNKYMVVPDKREFFSEISISHEKLNGAKKNDRVLVSIDRYTSKNQPIGTVLMVIGNKDSIKSSLDAILANNGLFADFSYNVINEVKKIPDTVTDINDREDLRGHTIITIDGDDSRDCDDAVSLEVLDNGNHLLGVHIADVTHYVREGTALDNEALRRGTSVYLPHTVIPMLPKELSNGICSLNPDVDRLTLSIFMEIDKDGNIHSNRIAETVIHSSYRMTYNNVNKILVGDTELCAQYKPIVPMLTKMNELAKKLAEKRKERGAIDFDFPETAVICDNEANPTEIVQYVRGDSHKLIESFMLIANETVAQMAFWSELPFVYRVHEAPSNEKLTEFNDFIKNFGYSIKGKLDSETIHPKSLQNIADKVKGTPEEFMISKMMLRSLMKACYRDTNDGHFGLAAKFYCHFTSPIRRYPDLIIHRILKEFINGRLNEDRQKHYEKLMPEAARISTDREIEAETIERDAVDILKTAYIREYIGESFDAIITSVTSFGMFAMLENSCEGLIRYETMNGDYFDYDDAGHIVIGNRTNKTYRIGDKIRITVISADITTRRIDFIREEDNNYHTVSRVIKRNEQYKPQKKKSKLRKHKRK